LMFNETIGHFSNSVLITNLLRNIFLDHTAETELMKIILIRKYIHMNK
jgi:hypothetical protein